MIRIQNCRLAPVLFVAFLLAFAAMTVAQEANPETVADIVKVTAGQKISLEGVILDEGSEGLTLRSSGGGAYNMSFGKDECGRSAIRDSRPPRPCH